MSRELLISSDISIVGLNNRCKPIGIGGHLTFVDETPAASIVRPNIDLCGLDVGCMIPGLKHQFVQSAGVKRMPLFFGKLYPVQHQRTGTLVLNPVPSDVKAVRIRCRNVVAHFIRFARQSGNIFDGCDRGTIIVLNRGDVNRFDQTPTLSHTIGILNSELDFIDSNHQATSKRKAAHFFG